MTSHGIDRRNGKVLSGWQHVLQSLAIIYGTRLGARVMRRTFGSEIPAILGKNFVPRTLLKFYTALAIATWLWEPRWLIRRVTYPPKQTNPDGARQGKYGFKLDGDYRPRALEGDYTVEGPERSVYF